MICRKTRLRHRFEVSIPHRSDIAQQVDMLWKCASVGLFVAVLATAKPVVHDGIADVTYVGVRRSGIEAFLNIPYGKDTGGANRFRPAQPYEHNKGTTFKATIEGPACPQPRGSYLFPLYLANVTDVSEDCLSLNIARPIGTKAKDGLPVHVHIHGGSFVAGSSNEPTVQPSGLILQSVANGNPIMQVNINYRLGVFGFSKSKALTKAGSANIGLRDQRMAIEWVRDHIASFGGNPRMITISGQSSGGLAVGMQLLAYGGKKPVPFQQAICQSQALGPAIMTDITDRAFSRLARHVSCDKAGIQSEAALTCLRSLTMDQLIDAQAATIDGNENIGDNWLPAIDGDFLPAAPSDLIKQHDFANVTTMMGWCEDDTQFFIPDNITTAAHTRAHISSYVPHVSAQNMDELLRLYPTDDFQADQVASHSAEFYRTGRIVRDILMTCIPLFYSSNLAAAGNQIYLFAENQTALTPLLDATDHSGVGVVHASDFAFIFANLSVYDLPGYPYQPRRQDYALARRQSRSWSSFMSVGKPSLKNRQTLRGWQSAFANPNQTDIFVIGGPAEGLSALDGDGANSGLQMQKLKARCDFFNSPEMIQQLRY